jgi:transposase
MGRRSVSVKTLYDYSIDDLIALKNKLHDNYSFVFLSIIINRYQGISTNELASIYNKHVSTVISYINKWNDYGFQALEDKRGGSKGTFTNEMLQTIKDALNNENPTDYGYESSTWTINMLIALIEKKFNIKYSYEWIRQVVKNNNFTYKRGQYKPSYANPIEQENFKKNAKNTGYCRKFY